MSGPDNAPITASDVLAVPTDAAAAPDAASLPLDIVAHMVARIAAAQRTPADEIPALVAAVSSAVAAILNPAPAERERAPQATLPARRKRGRPPLAGRRPGRPRKVPETPPLAAAPPPPPAPRLVRRAEAQTAAPVAEASIMEVPPNDSVRGVVRWFDPNRRVGELRLPGVAGDLPVGPAVFAAAGVTRLFKGQEVEAKISRAFGRVEVTALRVLGAPGTAPSATGPIAAMGGRRPRMVIVEKRRDSLRRVAARSAAEQVLGSPGDPKRSD